MTHAAMTPEARAAAGISDRLVRFSIGLEHQQDLIRDIFSALDCVAAPSSSKVAYLRKSSEAHAC
jgi:cystathionine gamma-synthase